MAERLYIEPPEIVDVEGCIIFLAGPIQGAPDWQSEAIKIIHELDSGIVIASPRKDYQEGTFVYEKQVDWETHYLNRSAKFGAIMFWLAVQTEATPGRDYAQTSRFELGEWKREHQHSGIKLILGIEKGFGNASYIRRRFGQDCPDVPLLDTLRSTCEKSVESIKVSL